MPAALTPGARIGPCTLTEAVGLGGAGVVWKAEHDTFGQVALKLLRIYDPALADRMRQEALLQQRIDSPHVVRVLDVFEHDGSPVLVQEFVPGSTLLRLLRERRLSLEEVDALAKGLFAGLAAAHAQGVIHRDLKLSNILLAGPPDRPRPMLADFGLARLEDRDVGGEALTHTGMVMGTPGYMAPEQIDDARAAGVPADIFALGVLLYRMVTGTMPFRSASRFEVFRRTRVGDCLPVQELRPDLPRRMAAAVIEAMRPNPATRADLSTVRALWQGELSAGTPQPDVPEPATHLEPTPLPTAIWIPQPLPEPARPLIGRVAERARATARLDARAPVVTLLGTAGVGKTHLALHLAAGRPRARFVDLSHARSDVDLAAAVSAVLGLAFRPGDPHPRIGKALSDAPGLLILDQPEAVAEPLRAALATWRAAAPSAQFLVTTRLFLGLPREALVELGPLPPDDAVAFFVACALEVKPSFAVQDDAVLRTLVDRVDRLPLALELAAARMRVLTPARLLERLGDRLDLLRAGRHGGLDEAVAFSWSLLPGWGRAALSACAGFVSGFALDAAEHLLEAVLEPFPDAPWPMDAVEVLVDHSLIRVHEPLPGTERFVVPPAVRGYALDRADDPDRWSRRRAAFFARCGEASSMRRLTGPTGPALTRALWLERGNLHDAVDRGLDDGDASVASGAALASAWLHRRHGPYDAGADLLGRVLSLGGHRAARRARLLRNRGRLLTLAGRSDAARDALTQALSAFGEVGDDRACGIVLGNLGDLAANSGASDTARTHYEDALERLEPLEDAASEAAVRGNLANLLRRAGDLAGARAAYERALALSRQARDRHGEALVLSNLASLHMDAGRPEAARTAYSDAIERVRELEDRSLESLLLTNRALLDRDQGRPSDARSGFEAAIVLAQAVGSSTREALARGNLGDLLVSQGQPTEARSQLEEAVRLADPSFPLAAGAFRGSLALLAARDGDIDHALTLLDAAEAQLEGVDAGELAKVREARAKVLRMRER